VAGRVAGIDLDQLFEDVALEGAGVGGLGRETRRQHGEGKAKGRP